MEKGRVHSGDVIRTFEKYVIRDWFAFFGICVSSLCLGFVTGCLNPFLKF